MSRALGILLIATLAGQPAASGLAVQKIWTTSEMSGRSGAGEVSISPDPSKALIVLDLTATGPSPVTVRIDQLVAMNDDMKTAPVGAAPVAPGNFDAFIAGYGSGWRIVKDAQKREVRVGRDTQNDPIQVTVAPGATVSIVYIVPRTGPPLIVTVPGAGPVALVAR